ncbi:MAG: T9SS type A sorting domain-containing protein [Bacteroidales bacterium]|nr:T9SS type A sorting domain-containing protein [Bacteroidales bacterium]
MKHLITLLAFMLTVLFVQGQYMYSDFDDNQNEEFSGWPNAPTVVANPDQSGINTSANVAEWVRTPEQWAHVFCELDGTVNFDEYNTFTMKVWAPIANEVLLKLENASGAFTEVSDTVESTEEWVELEFEFPDGESGVYDKIVIFFDFMATTDNTFYFDDVEGPGYGGGSGEKPLMEEDVQDNFENDGWATIPEWFFQDPDMGELPVVEDPTDPANHVAEYDRSGEFEWTNAQFELEHRMDLSNRNVFSISVYFPSSNDYSGDLTPTAALKLQDSQMGGNAWMTQTEVLHEVTEFDTWIDLEFDFSAVSDSTNYDKVVVQFGGEGHSVPGMFYFDDIYLMGGTSLEESPLLVNVKSYPNPVKKVLYLENLEKARVVQLYDVTGKLLYETKTNGESTLQVPVENIQPGIVILNIEDMNGLVKSRKLVKH